MIFLNSAQTKKIIPLMLEMDRQVYGEALTYKMTPELMAALEHPMSIYASAMQADTQKLLSYVCATVVCERYFQKLLKGEASEQDFEPWDEKDTPLLFIRSLVVRDRRTTPYIFRSMLKEIQQLFVDYELYVHRAFTIASHWATRRALTAYGFKEVGTYQGRFPILLASRDDSAVLNSLLKRYQV